MNIQHEITKSITAVIKVRAARITSGNCKSFDDYRAACGELVGLASGLRSVNQVFAKEVEVEKLEEAEWAGGQ